MPGWGGNAAAAHTSERALSVGRPRNEGSFSYDWETGLDDDEVAVESIHASAAIPMADEADGIWAQLAQLRTLDDDWDGNDGSRPNVMAINQAQIFLSQFSQDANSYFTKAMPLSDGSIALYWIRGSHYFEVGFDGSGTCYFLHMIGDQRDQGLRQISFTTAALMIQSALDLLAEADVGTDGALHLAA
jgi:hypothetical protein